MARRLLGGARGAVEVVAGVARHVLWYVSYRTEGTAREDDAPRRSDRS